MASIGIIANPQSGKDIRRLVSYATTIDNNEKVNICKRIVLAAYGIGIEKAQQIAYRTLTEYATSESQYADIRLYSLQSAIDLYGAESAELASVSDAWDAVGVTDGSTTGIEMVKQSQPALHVQSDKWYTLDGRQLEGKPTKKGLYIHHGKKVVVK